MNLFQTVGKRRGGRAAKQAERSATQTTAPVRPGQEGGWYRPLSAADVGRIHGAALDLLAEVGLADAIPSCVELVTAAGGRLTGEGRLLFPRTLVEDHVAAAGRHFVLPGLDPRHDLEPWGTKVHFGSAGAAVHMVDSASGEFRPSTLKDLYDIARLIDALEHIHFCQRPVIACDIEDSVTLDINTAYACISGTTKHVGTAFSTSEGLTKTLELLHTVAGGEAAWRARPFVSMSCCFVVPPLRFAEDACRCLENAVRAGMPVLLLAAGQAGATSPAALAGALVQQVAEVLAGLVYVNLIAPGHPAIFGTWPFVSDLRTGAMSGGSGEQALLMAACAQMAQHYDLPGGVAAGMTDAKLPDAQSGYEKGYSNALAGLAGANLVYEAAGMQASLMGACLESFVIDNDMLGNVMRTVRGIEVNDESISLEAIREVCLGGEGHFLGHHQTLGLMESEYLYPRIGDRQSIKEWREAGGGAIDKRARQRVREILDGHFPDHVPAAVDAALRRSHPIALPLEAMLPLRLPW
ncbi:MAG: trimethylamine methyltransferase family protein [Alphaproteobacteria bacterium]|jgi:trimethylamine--corrinoid protein Co-methyltransferase|nr:methyltransferase [Rhodospirillaceae bacterium]MDP6407591.1 trimethylamine methyltransferase family protein [Alphaproteobacteria bacterium]MDP6622946.1 trimethylamine methyltransferase family protein [Alphaproteobacteria bacterium]